MRYGMDPTGDPRVNGRFGNNRHGQRYPGYSDNGPQGSFSGGPGGATDPVISTGQGWVRDGQGHITLPPQHGPNIIIDQPNYFPNHYERHEVIIYNPPCPVYYPSPYYTPYPYTYPYGYPPTYPDPVVYVPVPQPEPQVVYVPQEPQVIYVPQQPQVIYAPAPTSAPVPAAEPSPPPAATEPPVVVIQNDGQAGADTSAYGDGYDGSSAPGDAGGVVNVPGAPTGSSDAAASANTDVGDQSRNKISSGALRAIADIQQSWLLSDPSLLERHTDPSYRIRVYRDGKFDYEATSARYLQLTHRAFQDLVTESFILDKRTRLADGRVRACGKHIFFDPDNHREVNQVCFWLQPIDGRWLITAIDTTVSGAIDEGDPGALGGSPRLDLRLAH